MEGVRTKRGAQNGCSGFPARLIVECLLALAELASGGLPRLKESGHGKVGKESILRAPFYTLIHSEPRV